MKYICIHGHFYQPPRENPWLEAIEPQDEAAPYHDWNERITAECYAPNTASRILDDRDRIVDIINNYGRISFDFGPTLLSWLEEKAPEVYRAVLNADRESRERFQGHGSALAQAYNHVILPLASREDKEIQVVWGIRDFELRFGRKPEGMWLPETAVDIESLEVLAAHDIRFTVLAPSQAARVRLLGKSEWQDVSGARVDPTVPYLQRLPSGRSIALFFYDGPASRAVAFERLLHRGENLARKLASIGQQDGRPRLGHIATDGETYGHHHPHGDMALAFALRAVETQALATLTNYGAFLSLSPPEHEVEILERTSWSCAHGVERWRSHCGCRTGGAPGWSQAWRAPLRESLDWLRLRVAPQLRRAEEATFAQPSKAVLDYVDLILDRSVDNVEGFLGRHALGPLPSEERVTALKLLELERQLQLMYTSCGWFFSDVSGIETVQVLRYSGRAVQLARDLFPAEAESLEREFLELLSRAKSNRAEMGSARELYERNVKPSQATFESLAAHYAISGLFEPYPEKARLYCFDVERTDSSSRQAGKMRLLSGTARITSRITGGSASLVYAVLHLGGHTVTAGVRRLTDPISRQALGPALEEPFEKGDPQRVLRLIDREFGPETYDLKSLFGDEQRLVLASLLRTTLEEAEAALGQLYEHHGATMRFLADLGVPAPRALSVAAEVVINSYLRSAFATESVDEGLVGSLIRDAAMEGISLDAPTLAFTARRSLEDLAKRFFDGPEDLDMLVRLRKKVRLVISMPFEVELWKVQNLYFHAMKRLLGETHPRPWLDEFLALGDDLFPLDPGPPVKSLRRLAAAYGVLTSYDGVQGLSRARPEALLAVLRVLGAPVERIEDADDALRQRREETARCLVPPVVTLWDDQPPSTVLTHFEGESGRARVSIAFEGGGRPERDVKDVEHVDLESLPIVFARRGVVHRLLALPPIAPGYHRLEVAFGERRSESTLLSAPVHSYRAYRGAESGRERSWGLFAPLYALHSSASLGVGDFSDLARFADLVSRHRGCFASTLPFLATFPEEPSPYSPVSRRFWNELFVDPRLAPEWKSVRSDASHPDSLAPLVDYREVYALKRSLLETMSQQALRVRPGFLEELLRSRPDAVEYARFRAASERRGPPWPSWSEPPPRDDLADRAFLYHLYGQALAEEQIAGVAEAAERKGVRLYFDMPLGVHGFGFDTWSRPALFATGAEVGAPPDPVFPDGQSWGFPPVVPERSRIEGHRYWRECLAHVMRHAGLLRIDHVMGMHRQFWIPAGFEKRDGVYVRYPAEELHAVASLESHRHRSELVGENLGIVPETVNRALDRHRWREIYVLQFRLTGNPERPLDPAPPNAVASFNTHDTPTFAGFRLCRDLDDRVEAGLLDREKARELAQARAAAVAALDARVGLSGDGSEVSRECLARWLQLLLESDADLVAINLEDLWLEEEPQNVPGRVDRPNWRRKLRHSLSSLPPEVHAILTGISRPA